MTGRVPRTPWGFRHVLAIIVLTAAAWLLVLLVVFAALPSTGPRRTFSPLTALTLTAVLYLILYGAIVGVIRHAGGWYMLGYRFPGWITLGGALAFLPVWYAVLAAVSIGSSMVINHGQPIPTNVRELFGPGGLAGIGRGAIALAFLVAAVIAPLVEETLFRGVLYQWLRGYLGVPMAVIFDGLLFAAAHLMSGVPELWMLLPALFVMGCLLAVTFQRTGSLFASMLLHGTNNAIAIAALLVATAR